MIPKTLGIFDSGLGGLTVVRELRKSLPQTHLVYLGDTARLPYGTKSNETIRRYLDEGCRFLETQGVEGIILACNTMSSLILERMTTAGAARLSHDERMTTAGRAVPLFGVIEPVARAAAQSLPSPSDGSIGILGTPATIDSGAYETAIKKIRPGAQVYGEAAPLLVPLVEEGWIDDEITRSIIRRYLSPLIARKIDLLILGCTHYPLLIEPVRKTLAEMGQDHVIVLENSLPLSRELTRQWGPSGAGAPGNLSIFVTDAPRRFSAIAERFLGEPLSRVQQIRLHE
jgi:glutamate racemase